MIKATLLASMYLMTMMLGEYIKCLVEVPND